METPGDAIFIEEAKKEQENKLEKPEYCPKCGSKDIVPIFAAWCNPQYLGYICSMCVKEIKMEIFPDAYIVYEEVPPPKKDKLPEKVCVPAFDILEKNNGFKVGDVVQLKSGGPNITINSFFDDNQKCVNCIWFVNGEVKEERFLTETIKKVEEK